MEETESKPKNKELEQEQEYLNARIEEAEIDESDVEDDESEAEYDESEAEDDEGNYEYDLTSFGIDFTAKGIVDKWADEEIFAPSFQRDYVWNNKKASQFIESLIMDLPVPGIFLALGKDKTYQVVDGLQRINSLYSFYKGLEDKSPLKLTKVHKRLVNKTYEDLDAKDRRTLDNAIIHATIIKVNDPEEENTDALFKIFERLNTGGMLLSAQEIRNSMFHKCDALAQINALAEEDYFKSFLGISDKRKKHQEICLRLFCLADNWKKYNIKNLKAFLNKCLDHTLLFQTKPDTTKPTDFSIEPDKEKFEKTFEIITKQSEITLRVKPNKKISLPLLDAVFVALYNNLEAIEKVGTVEVATEVKKALDSDDIKEFLGKVNTHAPENLKGRIRLINDAVEKKLQS